MAAGCAGSVRRFAMGPCVQMSNEVSEDVILVLCKFDDMILLLLLLVERVFLKMIHLQDKILKQRQV